MTSPATRSAAAPAALLVSFRDDEDAVDREDRVTTTSVASSRVAAVGVVIFCASLPLQWKALADVPGLGTLRYFHLGAVVMLLLGRPSPRRVLAMVRRSRPVPEGVVAFLACLALTALGYHSGVAEYVQVAVYIVVGLLGGACVVTALAHRQGRFVLAFASLAALLSFSVFFYRSMVAAHVDPETTLVRAVVTGDPTVIEYSLFRASFNGGADGAGDVRSNTRHEIFAALVVVFFLSLAAGAAIRSCRIVLAVSGALTLAMVVVSQSRSTLLAVGIVAALYVLRLVVYRRIRAGTIGLAVAVVAVTTVVFPSIVRLVVNRVTNTTSYDARLDAWDYSRSDFLRRLAFGGPELDVSTHTMVGDAVLRGGIMAALGAVLIVLGFARLGWQETRGFFRTNQVEYFGAMTIMTLVLVRAFTAGGGRLHLTEWFGWGAVLALQVTRRHRLGQDSPVVTAAPEPASLTVAGTTGSPSASPARAARPT